MFLWFQGSAVSWSGGVKEPVSPMGLLRYHWINFGMFSGCSMNWDWIEFIESYPSSTWNSSSYSSSRSSTSSTSPAQKPYKTLVISSNQLISIVSTPPVRASLLHGSTTPGFSHGFFTESHPGYGTRPQGQCDLGEEYSFGSWLSGAPGKPGRFRCVVGGWWLAFCFCFGPQKKAPKGTLKFQIPDEVVVSFVWKSICLGWLSDKREDKKGSERISRDKRG